MFVEFLETEDIKTLLFHPEVRWLSKYLSLERFEIFCEQVINVFKFNSQMLNCKYSKPAGKTREILEKFENTVLR